jgi:hypothetical protein
MRTFGQNNISKAQKLLAAPGMYVVHGCLIYGGELYKQRVLALRDRSARGVARNASCLSHRDYADSKLKPGAEIQCGS